MTRRVVKAWTATGAVAAGLLAGMALARQEPIPGLPQDPTSKTAVKAVRRCGTSAPESSQRAKLSAGTKAYRSLNAGPLGALGPVQVPVAVHIITNGALGAVTDAQVADQIAVLNADYAAHGFRFTLASTNRLDVGSGGTNKPAWFNLRIGKSEERQLKTSQRVDPERTLNLYTAKPRDPVAGEVLGFATFPWDLDGDPDMDGVVVDFTTLPGGAAPFNLGKTATHEVGHWLGLYHTFQGGCDPQNDEVDDTPAQAEGPNRFVCDESLDTCPSPGKDPIHNFMNYADDACLTEFTLGQRERMQAEVGSYRGLLIHAPARALLKPIQ